MWGEVRRGGLSGVGKNCHPYLICLISFYHISIQMNHLGRFQAVYQKKEKKRFEFCLPNNQRSLYIYISSKLILVTLRDLLCKNVFLFWKGPLNIGMGYVIDLFFGFFRSSFNFKFLVGEGGRIVFFLVILTFEFYISLYSLKIKIKL